MLELELRYALAGDDLNADIWRSLTQYQMKKAIDTKVVPIMAMDRARSSRPASGKKIETANAIIVIGIRMI